ncbi:hypothetical protein LLE49_22385 [Alicyclobacillus tolerans]|uniref:hypothetical protein n=1 Tax=Alicyclobacillus tolerans TaxID=90970 RepID=UPI001F426834|nr:hypothetical protein [Alicyclobacillus tolerans]MCF8567471.1 hypothetical protein [Alicyclobacillus tolerans]
MRHKRKRWLWLAILASFSLTSVSWAYYWISSTISVQVQARPASTLPSGQLAVVTPINEQITLTGKPHKIRGLALYKITLGNPSLSDMVKVHFYWVNPAQTMGVLHNGWIQVGVYYPTPSGSWDVYHVEDGPNTVSVSPDGPGFAVNPRNADAVLYPDVPYQRNLYVVVNIVDNGGENPEGQQKNLGDLQFYCQVSK